MATTDNGTDFVVSLTADSSSSFRRIRRVPVRVVRRGGGGGGYSKSDDECDYNDNQRKSNSSFGYDISLSDDDADYYFGSSNDHQHHRPPTTRRKHKKSSANNDLSIRRSFESKMHHPSESAIDKSSPSKSNDDHNHKYNRLLTKFSELKKELEETKNALIQVTSGRQDLEFDLQELKQTNDRLEIENRCLRKRTFLWEQKNETLQQQLDALTKSHKKDELDDADGDDDDSGDISLSHSPPNQRTNLQQRISFHKVAGGLAKTAASITYSISASLTEQMAQEADHTTTQHQQRQASMASTSSADEAPPSLKQESHPLKMSWNNAFTPQTSDEQLGEQEQQDERGSIFNKFFTGLMKSQSNLSGPLEDEEVTTATASSNSEPLSSCEFIVKNNNNDMKNNAAVKNNLAPIGRRGILQRMDTTPLD